MQSSPTEDTKVAHIGCFWTGVLCRKFSVFGVINLNDSDLVEDKTVMTTASVNDRKTAFNRRFEFMN